MAFRNPWIAAASATLVAVGLCGGITGTTAAAPAPLAPSQARFEGTTIDLSRDWGAAHACVVWQSRGVVDCYRTVDERDARAAQLEAHRDAGVAAASCAVPLHLYQDGFGQGRDLSFYDRGFWQNLNTYGFDNQMSSYRTGSCAAHLAENNGGGGFWYPGNTNANAYEPVVPAVWNDRVSSIFNV